MLVPARAGSTPQSCKSLEVPSLCRYSEDRMITKIGSGSSSRGHGSTVSSCVQLYVFAWCTWIDAARSCRGRNMIASGVGDRGVWSQSPETDGNGMNRTSWRCGALASWSASSPQRLAYDLQREYCRFRQQGEERIPERDCLLTWCSLGSSWKNQTCLRVSRGDSDFAPDYFTHRGYDPLYNQRNLDEHSLKDKDVVLAFAAFALLVVGGLVEWGFWARVASKTLSCRDTSGVIHVCWLAMVWLPTVVVVLVFALKTSGTWGMYNLPPHCWSVAAVISTLPFLSAAHYINWNATPADSS
ncbi:hypothetical protein CBR_g11206 [Chara braunii]|uniref:Uncharacterized protein n=1 Tax=Chara braunii TaxID=69332 RepID=A0A388KQK2_CHABU|nr:hypothetical protein CBR_g11206 [Chara braunii]|eukprot:GBG72278.1 hypothetical protein CBR_g11206 [Chara braunii]